MGEGEITSVLLGIYDTYYLIKIILKFKCRFYKKGVSFKVTYSGENNT